MIEKWMAHTVDYIIDSLQTRKKVFGSMSSCVHFPDSDSILYTLYYAPFSMNSWYYILYHCFFLIIKRYFLTEQFHVASFASFLFLPNHIHFIFCYENSSMYGKIPQRKLVFIHFHFLHFWIYDIFILITYDSVLVYQI